MLGLLCAAAREGPVGVTPADDIARIAGSEREAEHLIAQTENVLLTFAALEALRPLTEEEDVSRRAMQRVRRSLIEAFAP